MRDPANWPRYQALLPHTDALVTHHTPDHDTDHTAEALIRAANYRQEQGVLVPALHAYQRALTARERMLGTTHPHTLASRNALAYAYEAAGDLGRAIPLYERTLADSERVLSPGHPADCSGAGELGKGAGTAGCGRTVVMFRVRTPPSGSV
ncbi:tetratricopeptide repeat protein [Streptomyces xanthophaeus]